MCVFLVRKRSGDERLLDGLFHEPAGVEVAHKACKQSADGRQTIDDPQQNRPKTGHQSGKVSVLSHLWHHINLVLFQIKPLKEAVSLLQHHDAVTGTCKYLLASVLVKLANSRTQC